MNEMLQSRIFRVTQVQHDEIIYFPQSSITPSVLITHIILTHMQINALSTPLLHTSSAFFEDCLLVKRIEKSTTPRTPTFTSTCDIYCHCTVSEAGVEHITA